MPCNYRLSAVSYCTIPKMVIYGIVVSVLSVIYHADYIALYAVYFGYTMIFIRC